MREWLFLLLGLLGSEAAELSPHLMKKLVQRVSRGLPEEHREVLEETWLAELEAVPGKLAKLTYVLPLITNVRELHQALREAEGYSPSDTPAARFLARLFNLLFVMISMPAWVIVVSCIALAIWLEDGGHPFVRLRRVGLDGREFYSFSFRTTKQRSYVYERELLKNDLDFRYRWSDKNFLHDPKYWNSRVGTVVRRYGLVNLPSLLNVLLGDMALTGPMPTPVRAFRIFPPDIQKERTLVLPGLISVAELPLPSEFKGDVYEKETFYIKNWSIYLDMRIIVYAIWKLLTSWFQKP